MTLQLHHRVVVIRFQRQIAVLRITFEDPSFLQESGHTVTDGMYKLPNFLNIWGINSLETQISMPIFHVHAGEKKHVAMNIHVKGRTETLDQGDRAGLCRAPICCNAATMRSSTWEMPLIYI
jgi:hypothetical protein